jgi:hypothetical protein
MSAAEALVQNSAAIFECIAKPNFLRTFADMDARFEIRLSRKRREELGDLARECGLSAADVARLGISWMIEHRDLLLRRPAAPPIDAENAA